MKNFLMKIIAVGKVKDPAFQAKCTEFARWLAPTVKLEQLELRDSDVGHESAAILKALENERGYVVVLAEEGETVTSREFAARLGRWDRKVVFVIGGPFGLDAAVKQRADWLFSLSPLTMTHEMARVWLLEQLFRAVSILEGKKYHHD